MKYESWGGGATPPFLHSRVANKLKLKYAVHKVLGQHATVWAFWNVFQLFLSSLHWAIEGCLVLCSIRYASVRFWSLSGVLRFCHFLAFGFEGFEPTLTLNICCPPFHVSLLLVVWRWKLFVLRFLSSTTFGRLSNEKSHWWAYWVRLKCGFFGYDFERVSSLALHPPPV